MPKVTTTHYRLGEENINRQGALMRIVQYRRSDDIDILFPYTGNIVTNREYADFKKGQTKDVMYPSIYGIGILGSNISTIDANTKKPTVEYILWCGMLERVIKGKYDERYSVWQNSTISDLFLNFTKFNEWCKSNMWLQEHQCLDKDILIKGNKMYSEDTCVLVDNRLNCLLTKNNKARGEHPIGVYKRKKNGRFTGKFVSQCSMVHPNGKKRQIYLGDHSTPEEAFLAYKKFKENYIKQVADEYKEKYPNFPQKLYDAMYNYVVEITD